jgi:hypothetical protein
MAGMRQKVFESNNKGLFDIAVGEGNISADYATELQNARVALNGEVSKRRGRSFYNTVSAGHAAGNSIDTYASSNHDAQLSMYSANNEQVGFAVTLASDKNIQTVDFYLDKVGTPTADSVMKAKIYAVTGSVGTSGLPTGALLATSIDVNVSVLTGSFAFVQFTFEEPYTATAGNYAIFLEYNSGNSSNYVRIGTDSSSPSHGSNAFATNTVNTGWVADTTQDIIFKLNSAGPNIDSLMIYEGDYPDTFEVLVQADTRLLRYSSTTGGFSTVIKTGLTVDYPLNWTMFRTKLCMSNGTDNPFKYGYMPKPATPTTGTGFILGGSKTARTYYVTATYVTANGESIASEEATQAIGINYVAQPAFPTTSNTTLGSKASRTYYVSTTYITANGESTPSSFGAASTAVLTGGVVTSATITSGGSTYASVPTVTFSGGGGVGAIGTAVVIGGVVTSITIGSGGSGYTSEPTITFSGGEVVHGVGVNEVLTVTSPAASAGATGWNVYHHTASGALKLQNVSPIAIGTNYTETTGSLNDGALPPTSNTGWYGNVATVTSPLPIVGATGWNVYHHTVSGAAKLQNVSPIAIGTNYTETNGALNDGAVAPTANTAWHVTDLADIPPKGKYIIALNNRLWISGVTGRDTKFTGSAVDDEDDWTTASDFVDIDLAGVLSRGDAITGLGRLGQSGKLIIGLRNHIVTYSVPAVFSDIAIDKIVYNTGVMGHRAMDEVGLDNYLVEPEGVNSVKAELIIQGLRTKKLSDNIRDRLNPLLKAVVNKDEVNVVNNKKHNEFWINIPSISRRYVYDYSIKAWMEDRNITTYQSIRTPDGDILSGGKNGRVYKEYQSANNIDVYGDGGDNTNVSWRWDTPWLWLNNIGIKKLFKYFQFKGSGAAGVFKLEVFFDFEVTPYSTFYLQSLPSKWGTVEWESAYWDFPDVNKVLIPMVGMGRAVKFSFTADHKTDISIAFYGVKYVPSGYKAND